MSADRFLVIRLSAVGDVVNTLPTLSLLRRARPDATIGFAVEDRACDLLEAHPMLDRLHVFPRKRWRAMAARPSQWGRLAAEVGAYRRELRAARYDVAIDVQGNLKGAAHAVAAGAASRIGFARGHDREGNHWLSNEHVVPPADRPHRVDKFASLLGPLGIHGREREWVFPDTTGDEPTIASFLAAHHLTRDAFVLIHPGTSGRGAAKRWPEERFAELARRAVAELGRPVVVSWGPGEEELARVVVDGSEGVVLGPRTASLRELLVLVRWAAVFVSADTGPMHLAAGAGTRCVALFGPKDPRIYAPYGEGHTVLYRPEGMASIPVDDVLAAVANGGDGP